VQQHRLARDPSELLQLLRPGARPAARGNNDYTDITLHLRV